MKLRISTLVFSLIAGLVVFSISAFAVGGNREVSVDVKSIKWSDGNFVLDFEQTLVKENKKNSISVVDGDGVLTMALVYNMLTKPVYEELLLKKPWKKFAEEKVAGWNPQVQSYLQAALAKAEPIIKNRPDLELAGAKLAVGNESVTYGELNRIGKILNVILPDRTYAAGATTIKFKGPLDARANPVGALLGTRLAQDVFDGGYDLSGELESNLSYTAFGGNLSEIIASTQAKKFPDPREVSEPRPQGAIFRRGNGNPVGSKQGH